jgi:hypothetical protein
VLQHYRYECTLWIEPAAIQSQLKNANFRILRDAMGLNAFSAHRLDRPYVCLKSSKTQLLVTGLANTTKKVAVLTVWPRASDKISPFLSKSGTVEFARVLGGTPHTTQGAK